MPDQSNQEQINQGQSNINLGQGQTNQDQGRTNQAQSSTNRDQIQVNDQQARTNEAQAETNREQREFNSSIDRLMSIFERVNKGLASLAREFRDEKRLRKKASIWFVVLGAVVIFLVTGVLVVGILNHQNTVSVKECTSPPLHPHPHGTPINQLTCYERSQLFTGAYLNGLAQYDQDVIKAAKLNQPLPPPIIHVAIPATN